jgi:uncharacterized repeat protein (TIGR01451 family)
VISNTIVATSTTALAPTAIDSHTMTVEISTMADLVITKGSEINPVTAGEEVSSIITIFNNGPSDAQTVEIRDVPVEKVSNVMFSMDNGTTWRPWENVCFVGTIPMGDFVLIKTKGTVDPAARGYITNEITVKSATKDSVDGNNSSIWNTEITAVANLKITHTVSPNPIFAGRLVTYTITAVNDGPSDAYDTYFTFGITGASVLGLEYSNDGGETWAQWEERQDYGTIAAGTSVSFLIRGVAQLLPEIQIAEIKPFSAPAIITSTVSVTSDEAIDQNPGNNKNTITAALVYPADLSIKATTDADHNAVHQGDMLNYTLRIENLGPSNATDIVIHDFISPLLTHPEISFDKEHWQPHSDTRLRAVAETIANLPIDTIIYVYVRGTVPETIADGTVIPFSATVNSNSDATADPNPDNNKAVANVTVAARSSGDQSIFAPTLENALNRILASIAMEEVGLSHILNAEGEKIQYALGTLPGQNGQHLLYEQVMKINNSVRKTLMTIAQNQLFLNVKLQNAVNKFPV